MSIINNFINTFYLRLDRRAKRWIFRFIDIFVFALSIYFAFILRFDIFRVGTRILQYKEHIYLLFPIKFIIFWIVGVYRPVLRYAGMELIGTSFIAVVGSSGVLVASGILLNIGTLPRSILILDAILTLILMISVRLSIRWTVYVTLNQVEKNVKNERVIIYGAGDAGSQLAQALAGDNHYKVIGFVDDNKQLHNQVISGVKIYSPKKLPKLIEKYDIDSILLAIISAGKQRSKEVIESLQQLNVQIKTIPGAAEIISGKVSINEIRAIDVIDLLGREEIEPDSDLLQKNIKDKVVLITGAGGSIGSELCRQIIQQQPKCLVLYEINEFALYNIDIELSEFYPGIEVYPCLGCVTNKIYLSKILKKYRVDTIYHAAAYKHVPLIESNISRGVLNNVKGTFNCIEAAKNCNVETFVMISTDKAVRPTNVMGTTKRVAEMVLQAKSQIKDSSTCFIIVRFGNVLDSAGSVVPRFRKQIEEGKNLTLTHKEITRYFMSIPEAARLVIQAGAIGQGGEVFLLDMGEPVKIYDLAVQMIDLSGLKLGQDIDIEISGLRPGEKLFEELLIDRNNVAETIHPKVFKAEEPFILWEELESMLKELFAMAEQHADQEILLQLKELVPEFNHNGNF